MDSRHGVQADVIQNDWALIESLFVLDTWSLSKKVNVEVFPQFCLEELRVIRYAYGCVVVSY
jgi:hypothetical protein